MGTQHHYSNDFGLMGLLLGRKLPQCNRASLRIMPALFGAMIGEPVYFFAPPARLACPNGCQGKLALLKLPQSLQWLHAALCYSNICQACNQVPHVHPLCIPCGSSHLPPTCSPCYLHPQRFLRYPPPVCVTCNPPVLMCSWLVMPSTPRWSSAFYTWMWQQQHSNW